MDLLPPNYATACKILILRKTMNVNMTPNWMIVIQNFICIMLMKFHDIEWVKFENVRKFIVNSGRMNRSWVSTAGRYILINPFLRNKKTDTA